MAGRVLSFSRTSPVSEAVETGPFCDFSGISTDNALRSNCDMEMDSMAGGAGLGCFRGTAFALMFEAAAGLAIYAVWQLIHLHH